MNCTIGGGKIWSDSYNHGIFLSSCNVSNATLAIGCCGGNLNITSSNINGCSFIHDGGSQGVDEYLRMKQSVITNSKINVPFSSVDFNRCDFIYNSAYNDTACVISGNGFIDSSSFLGNGGRIAIERGPHYPGPGNTSNNYWPFTITYCSFQGFATDIKLNGLSGSNYGSGAVDIHYCDFRDRPSGHIVYNYSPYAVAAQNNWWGTTSIAVIDSSIYDFWDDIVNGIVHYTNFLSSPSNPTLSIRDNFQDSKKCVLYPNPFTSGAKLRFAEPQKNSLLRIFDVMGREIDSFNVTGDEFDLEELDLSPGVYVLNGYGTTRFQIRFIVE